MNRIRTITVTAALLSTAALSIAWAAQPVEKSRSADKIAGITRSGSPEGCEAMNKMCDEMASKQKADDVAIQRLIATMNQASGTPKVDAMAAVITELVKQRTEYRTHMMTMGSSMNDHMMQHIASSVPGDMSEKIKKGMDGCSMMHASSSDYRRNDNRTNDGRMNDSRSNDDRKNENRPNDNRK